MCMLEITIRPERCNLVSHPIIKYDDYRKTIIVFQVIVTQLVVVLTL